MIHNKEIIFLIKVMNGGGAERVISLLSGELCKRNYDVKLILTHQKLKDAFLRDIADGIQVISLEDELKKKQKTYRFADFKMLSARLIGKLSKMIKGKESEISLVKKYESRNFPKVMWLRHFFKDYKNSTIIAFLYDSIFLSLLAKRNTNKIIISERGDPQQSASSRTTMAFLRRMFPKADHIVFQSPDVSNWYLEKMGVKGTVIFNPIKKELPERHAGKRKKRIVNFCRISEQKNLELLVEAYDELHKDYPEYQLYIYGDAVGNGADGYVEKIQNIIRSKGLDNSVHMLPARKDIHEEIKDYAMFVSSSDFEGMSNSMLEAMAMGLPVVCTDCPAGGARAVIRNYENGILVPVKDKEKMYQAMKSIIEDSRLAERLSECATNIRNEQSVEHIIEKWMEIIND